MTPAGAAAKPGNIGFLQSQRRDRGMTFIQQHKRWLAAVAAAVMLGAGNLVQAQAVRKCGSLKPACANARAIEIGRAHV